MQKQGISTFQKGTALRGFRSRENFDIKTGLCSGQSWFFGAFKRPCQVEAMQNPARRRTIICLVLVVFGVWKLVTEVAKKPLMETMHGQDGTVRGMSRADRFQHFLQDTGSHVRYEEAKSSEEVEVAAGIEYRGRFGQYLKLKESKDQSRHLSAADEASSTNGSESEPQSTQS